ncbi:hypothetical protein V22_21770 [Calycomorphotria hydatis]|uniref:Carboxypeptidase regulatory-like domain-containing protein n=2 Tax=Calycomorphotria hydatis TaxID=2528027 RepID=A0A517T968_9PLAN|nr:hypothetical protein V22_21770 [Calycomorphotria hydatis]
MHRLLILFPLICITLTCGCFGSSDEIQKYSLSGEVTFQGEPVPRGQIRFIPDYNAGNQGPASTVTIVDGRYETRDGYGIVGGAYQVQIEGYEPSQVDDSNLDAPPQPEKPLFANYKTQVEFEKKNSSYDFVVTSN